MRLPQSSTVYNFGIGRNFDFNIFSGRSDNNSRRSQPRLVFRSFENTVASRVSGSRWDSFHYQAIMKRREMNSLAHSLCAYLCSRKSARCRCHRERFTAGEIEEYFNLTPWPNKSSETTAIGAVSFVSISLPLLAAARFMAVGPRTHEDNCQCN